jgi:hypothetical protein
MSDDWSAEETDYPLHADRRNFCKVEKWGKDGQHIGEMLFLTTIWKRLGASSTVSSRSARGRD